MAPVRIEDADDPRIAEFRSIRERDLTGREGRFIAEGTVVLRMLAAAHGSGGDFLTEKILLLENRVAGLAEILGCFPADIPVYVASAAVLDQIAGFHLHRGVLALGRRRQERTASELVATLPDKALVVAAFGISNHDNIGSIFRNAAAFGADAVLLDESCCDPLYRKALRVVPASDRMVLITGTEGEGLPVEVLARIQSARIAQAPGLDSLNAATATGIALYEIAMAQGRL
ncbi:RNA methyltransferase [Caulobacter sp. D4A]|uniref:TrmH family RNA methyltransferase n=1 Tax=Caulobacter sp. D4A TaxID=2204171 RepID=UPI000D735EAB|nr:RNA methyltransferase [Caulobacter sp. D4A]PXA83079.1 RNA methyltransferase [Caulobacter sp. D4A]